jgi:maleate isomerase
MTDRTLLGILTPSSNTRLEPLTARMLEGIDGVSAHFSRFRVVDVGLAAANQFDPEPILAAADLLADARVDAIAWSGTSGGWRGLEDDRALCAAISERTGIPSTTSTLALIEALGLLGASSLGLVTPYPVDMHAAVVSTFESAGLDVIDASHAVTASNWELSEIPPAVIAGLVEATAAEHPDAITIFCTNLATADLVADWEDGYGIPVLDSVTLAVWHALELSGYAGPVPQGWGRLFDLGR